MAQEEPKMPPQVSMARGCDNLGEESLLAAVVSLPHVQHGATNSSSGHFSTETASDKATYLLWKIGTDNPKYEGIHFDVKESVSGTNPYIFKHIYDGNKTPVERFRALYIANPAGAAANFTVYVYQGTN